jgi:hypothetical protein
MRPTKQDYCVADSNFKALKSFMSNETFMATLQEKTAFLPPDSKTKQRLWHVINDQFTEKFCKCGNTLNWNYKNNSYRIFCSPKCVQSDTAIRDRIETTCLKKYGSKTILMTEAAKLNYSKKMIEKFGVDNPFKSANVQKEIKDRLFEEHGVTNIAMLGSTKEKITNTCIERYGRIRKNQEHLSNESFNIKYDKQKLSELYDGGLSIKEIADKLEVGHTQLCVQFKNLGIEIHQTVGQQQMFDYITSIYSGPIIFNDRKALSGKEIDIYLPELGIGFEYDGIFWHSEESANKINYHTEKDSVAKSVGIKLYHIIDIEWNNKRDLVKSRIASFVGVSSRIYARKTTVNIIDKKIAARFFNENHIQGHTGASFYAGLHYEGRLVAAISLGKSRYNRHQYELIRFCNELNINVIGGASKLFNFATQCLNASDVVSFCDLRWGTGKVYEKLGFKHIRNNPASYVYTHNYKTLESRIKYQKYKLKNVLNIFDSSLSAWENMRNNGFDRYWNSGNAVYVWTKG